MSNEEKSEPSGGLYERRIGTPTTVDEVNGYRLFAFGVLLGLAGVAVFFATEAATTARAIGYALAALAPPFLVLGAVIRFPLRAGTSLGYLGTAVSVAGVVWFVNRFPAAWSTETGDPTVITVYGIGLILIGLAGTVVPLVTDPVREDYERMRTESAAATERAAETGDELAATREDQTDAEAEAVADDEGPEPADAAGPDVDVPTEDAAPESGATFELFADSADGWRFRLRHDNGNVVGDSGEGYASRSNAVEAVTRVKANAPGAETVEK